MSTTQERQTFAAQYQEEAKEILVLTNNYHKGFVRTDKAPFGKPPSIYRLAGSSHA